MTYRKTFLIPDDGKVIFSLAWSQGVGCAIMGFVTGQKNSITAM